MSLLTRYNWIVFPLLAAIVIIFILIHFQAPLFLDVFGNSKELFSLFSERESMEELSEQVATVRSNFSRLETLAVSMDTAQKNSQPLIDLLYPYATESRFTLLKVETGIPFQIENYHETSVTLKGRGDYESIGKFTERIENSSQSTRIRQIMMSGTDDEQVIDAIMEFIIISE